MSSFLNYFIKEIWIPNNDKPHAWERARNISRKDKRKRPKKLNSSNKPTSTSGNASRVRVTDASGAQSSGSSSRPFLSFRTVLPTHHSVLQSLCGWS
ncbi:unnamed protein product [Rhizophagus irregularis]|uniref:Uncharacterized protein n=1 Tax=Rhizophagus irregularis TaxID=588596 RepID=A0A915YWS5_9GLOM|nr:unnamed protein product [Rhizophagus irregularis]